MLSAVKLLPLRYEMDCSIVATTLPTIASGRSSSLATFTQMYAPLFMQTHNAPTLASLKLTPSSTCAFIGAGRTLFSRSTPAHVQRLTLQLLPSLRTLAADSVPLSTIRPQRHRPLWRSTQPTCWESLDCCRRGSPDKLCRNGCPTNRHSLRLVNIQKQQIVCSIPCDKNVISLQI